MSEDEYNPGGGGEVTKKPKESYFMYYFSISTSYFLFRRLISNSYVLFPIHTSYFLFIRLISYSDVLFPIHTSYFIMSGLSFLKCEKMKSCTLSDGK